MIRFVQSFSAFTVGVWVFFACKPLVGADPLLNPPLTINGKWIESSLYPRRYADAFWHYTLAYQYIKHSIPWEAGYFYDDPAVIRLCEAITSRDIDEMRRLIAAGADVNAIGRERMTPLYWAFHVNDDPRPFGLLLKHGASPNVITRINNRRWRRIGLDNGYAVVHLVALGQYNRHYKSVFTHGGDPNLRCEADVFRRTALGVLILRGADGEERLQTLIDAGVDFNVRREYGFVDDKLGPGTHYGKYGKTFLSGAISPLLTETGRRINRADSNFKYALIALENGASPDLYYTHDRFYRGGEGPYYQAIHYLAMQAPQIRKRRADERVYFEKVVSRLEERGYSIKAAQEDLDRWEQWEEAGRQDLIESEFLERKKRDRPAASPATLSAEIIKSEPEGKQPK